MKKHSTEAELQAARNGYEPALAAIIAKQMPAIRYFAKRAVRPGLDLEDAVQEGLIGLFHAIEQYSEEGGSSFSTYASACIRNAISTARRTAGRKKHAPLNHSVPIPERQSVPGPEDAAIAHEQVDMVIKKVRSALSPMEKAVLYLYIEGFSYAQIAQTLGKPTKAVENALARVRRKLR